MTWLKTMTFFQNLWNTLAIFEIHKRSFGKLTSRAPASRMTEVSKGGSLWREGRAGEPIGITPDRLALTAVPVDSCEARDLTQFSLLTNFFPYSFHFPNLFTSLLFSLLYSFFSSLSYSLHFSALFTLPFPALFILLSLHFPPSSLPYFLHFPTLFTSLLFSLL
jgi:hypothetical protein